MQGSWRTAPSVGGGGPGRGVRVHSRVESHGVEVAWRVHGPWDLWSVGKTSSCCSRGLQGHGVLGEERGQASVMVREEGDVIRERV